MSPSNYGLQRTTEDHLNLFDNYPFLQPEFTLPVDNMLVDDQSNRNEESCDNSSLDSTYAVSSSQSPSSSPLLTSQSSMFSQTENDQAMGLGSLNLSLSDLIDEQIRMRAKERRRRRMLILKAKRQSGMISFDVNQVRYKNKRRR